MKVQEARLGSASPNRKQKKKAKNRFGFIKAVLIVLLLTGALTLIALSPFFNITSIDTKGSQHYRKEDIIESSNLLVGENGFKTLALNTENVNNLKRALLLRCAVAEDLIMVNRPYIKTVNAKFVLPGTFDIVITERKPMGFVPYMGTNLVIDDEAYVVDTTEKPGKNTIPVIKGLTFSSYEMGQPLKLENQLEFDTVNKILRILKESDENSNLKFVAPINSIDVSNLSKVSLMVDSRIIANFGDVYNLNNEELLYRIDFFKQIFTKNLKKQDKGIVDFTLGENPKFIPD